MAFIVDFEIERVFEAPCGFEPVFNVLADVPASIAHFPKVDVLEDEGDGVYRLEMEKIGFDKYHIQTIYTSKYVGDRDEGTVKWTPAKGETDNAAVRGKWVIKPMDETKTRVTFSTKGELEIPLPRLLKMVLSPVVKAEFTGLIDRYIANLNTTFEKAGKTPAKKTPAKKTSAKKAPAKKTAKKKAAPKKK